MTSINCIIDDLEIRIDRRTVLLGIIEIISNYRNKYPFLIEKKGNQSYIEEIEATFQKYQTHPVVLLFNEITECYDFSFSRPIDLFLQLGLDFSLQPLKEKPFQTDLKGDTRVLEMLSMVKAFANEIAFDEFYHKMELQHKSMIEILKAQLDGLFVSSFLQNYYGFIQEHFVVNLIPWRTYGCYGTKNKDEIYAHLCCFSKHEHIYPKEKESVHYASFLVHEFGHSFVNPLALKYEDTVQSIMFNNQEVLRKNGYGSPKSILNDYIVRAVTLRYLQEKDLIFYQKQKKQDELFGFVEIEEFGSLLSIYEKNRQCYFNIEAFYPQIIQFLKEEKEYTPKSKI